MNDLWEHALDSVRGGQRTVLVMVVDHQGSVPGTTGAAMVVSSLGCAGTVGGGTAEHAMIERARGFEGAPELVDIEHTPEAHGTLCSGRQTIALVSLARSDEPALAAVCDALRDGRVGTLHLSSTGMSFAPGAITPRCLTTDATGFRFATTLGRLDTLTIVGGGHCALALSRVIATLPFRIVVLDDRPDLPTLAANRFADEIRTVNYADLAAQVPEGDRSWVVVMTFGHAHDETALRALAGHRVRYLGLLGSAAKVAALFAAMRADGVPESFLSSIRAPVGMPICSHTPEEIAVSIAAEIIRERNAEERLGIGPRARS
jgi:xanthine dehydrogenase accessory factor